MVRRRPGRGREREGSTGGAHRGGHRDPPELLLDTD